MMVANSLPASRPGGDEESSRRVEAEDIPVVATLQRARHEETTPLPVGRRNQGIFPARCSEQTGRGASGCYFSRIACVISVPSANVTASVHWPAARPRVLRL